MRESEWCGVVIILESLICRVTAYSVIFSIRWFCLLCRSAVQSRHLSHLQTGGSPDGMQSFWGCPFRKTRLPGLRCRGLGRTDCTADVSAARPRAELCRSIPGRFLNSRQDSVSAFSYCCSATTSRHQCCSGKGRCARQSWEPGQW